MSDSYPISVSETRKKFLSEKRYSMQKTETTNFQPKQEQ